MRGRFSLVMMLLLPLLGLGAQACATGDGMVDKLYDTTRAYNRSLRWADFDRASEHLPPASSDAFLDQHDLSRDKLVIIDYEMMRLKVNKQEGTAAARVQVQWHTDDRLIVEKTVVDQVWQWYEGRWFLVDERRISGEPVVMFAEGEKIAGVEEDHPYLPGLIKFREERGIGLEGAEKAAWEREQ